MNKLYFRILFSFVIFVSILNISNFLAGFNPKQLVNFAYFKERTIATYFLAKNIILHTGIHIKLLPEDELDTLINEISSRYNIDKEILSSFVDRNNQFAISTNGGMGLTSISDKYFKESGLKDPFQIHQNLSATAYIIKKMMIDGVPVSELKNKFYGIKKDVFIL